MTFVNWLDQYNAARTERHAICLSDLRLYYETDADPVWVAGTNDGLAQFYDARNQT